MYNLLLSSRLKVITVALVLFLVASSAYPQQRSSRVPPYVYSTWTIYRFVEVSGHAGQTKERAEAQIDKTLKIGVRLFDHDKNLLWLENVACKNVNYRMESPVDSGQGTLTFYGIKTASIDIDDLVTVICNKHEVFTFELAENQELAAYYDGWFFFFRKS
jgi:hypothetical protein